MPWGSAEEEDGWWEGKLRTNKAIRVVPLQVLDRVPRVTCPLPDLAVGLHGVDKVTAAVLECDGVAVVVEHLRDEVHGVRVERESRVVNDSERMELMSKRGFRDDELGGVGPAGAEREGRKSSCWSKQE